MRCDNCGWKNLSEKKNCEKCSALLKEEEVGAQVVNLSSEEARNDYMQTIIEKNDNENNLLKTLKIDG